MSCYFRHLKDIMDETGITVTPQNKKEIDRAIHELVGTTYKDCPATWKSLKKELLNEQTNNLLIQKLRNISIKSA